MDSLSVEQLTLVANTVRMLSVQAIEAARSGHPGMPLGMADLGAVLWLKYLKVNPEHPDWLNRDRFVLSNGHGSMYLYSFLHLLGFDLSIDEIKRFRQLNSKTPGHPEFGITPGVESTTGPLGQGLANAVGMAIAQKLLANRYNTPNHKIIDHRIWCMVGDGCLMEGISAEACSLAGHLGLNNLIVIYDDNQISIAGSTKLAFSENVQARFEACNWRTLKVDGHDYEAVDKVLAQALMPSGQPTLILAQTIIGKGSPNKAATADCHGAPLGEKEAALTAQTLSWPSDKTFFVPPSVQDLFAERRAEMNAAYNSWTGTYAEWSKANPELALELSSRLSHVMPDDLDEKLLLSVQSFLNNKPVATRRPSANILQAAAGVLPALVGGSADLEPSTLTVIRDSSSIAAEQFSGRNLHFGVREHAMGGVMNGLAYYGGFLPFGSTFLSFADYMRPAIRMAALANLHCLFIFTHDSIFVGEDGPTHQPIEHVSSLRMIPNLWVMRPGDAVETAVCYGLALKRVDGPTALILSRQDFPQTNQDFSQTKLIARGAYTIYQNSESSPELVIIGTGSEVPLALEAGKQLAKGLKVRVVSLPCWNLFSRWTKQEKEELIPRNARKVVIEAGSTFGWLETLQANPESTLLLGINDFGLSAPSSVLASHFGFTSDMVLSKIREKFGID